MVGPVVLFAAADAASQFKGPTLVGEPDPGFPNHTPIYGNDGTRVGWVRTEDIPG